MPVIVPFNRATVAPNQVDYVVRAMSSGHLAGDGEFTSRATSMLSRIHLNAPVLLTTSCTDALEMAAILLDLRPGDEVIVPSFTFVSSANAFVIHGATVVFVDIDPVTLNLDPEQVRRALTGKTRAVVSVNYGGRNALVPELVELCRDRGVPIIEDNAHGLFGIHDGRPLGTAGLMSTLSFHETKNVTSGEGGALVLNDPALLERAEIIREKGTNRRNFRRGVVDKYTWVDVGSSFLMSDVNAAMLAAQLEFAEETQKRRRNAVARYEEELAEWAAERRVTMPLTATLEENPWHMFPLIFPGQQERDSFIASMAEKGVACPFHYVPLHSSPGGRLHGRCVDDCPHSSSVSSCLARLPLFSDMSQDETSRVIEAVLSS